MECYEYINFYGTYLDGLTFGPIPHGGNDDIDHFINALSWDWYIFCWKCCISIDKTYLMCHIYHISDTSTSIDTQPTSVLYHSYHSHIDRFHFYIYDEMNQAISIHGTTWCIRWRMAYWSLTFLKWGLNLNSNTLVGVIYRLFHPIVKLVVDQILLKFSQGDFFCDHLPIDIIKDRFCSFKFNSA